MAKVFLSHAYGDKKFCEEFLQSVLVYGMGLRQESDVFYSSGRDTGVPSGADLMSWVRKEVSDSTLVIAIVTPLYLTRRVCVAELGAAWGKAGDHHLFPLLAPGVSISDLDGVLPHSLCPSIEDRGALMELYERTSKMHTVPNSSVAFSAGVESWLAKAPLLAEKLEVPELPPTAKDYEALQERVVALEQALREESEQTIEWKDRCDQLLAVKDSVEARQIMVGDDVASQVEDALKELKKALDVLNSSAAGDVIFEHLRGNFCPYPNPMQGDDAQNAFEQAIRRELIHEADDGLYEPHQDKRMVKAAVEAAELFKELLETIEADDRTSVWFSEAYGLEPRLTDSDTWTAFAK